MIDYHVHPGFSPDADGTMVEFCDRAVAVGLAEICFTTHYEPDPVRRDREWVNVAGARVPVQADWAEHYLAAIDACRGKFGRLTVLAGVEVGYEPGLETAISTFLDRHRFDFVLGAVHSLDHVALTSGSEVSDFRQRFGGRPPAEVVRLYFEHMASLVDARLFDSVAHLDAYRKYIRPIYDDRFDAAVEAELPGFIARLVRSGTALEVNTSALRRGMTEPYPAWAIVEQARAAGARGVTVGSDAHRPQDVGSGIAGVVGALARLGLRPLRFRARLQLAD